MASPAPYNPGINKSILALAAIAILVGVFFRVHHLDQKTFWGDEILGQLHMLGYTEAELVRAGPDVRRAADIKAFLQFPAPANGGPRPLTATIRSLASEDPQHPPVFYLMQRIWASWAGVTPAALRTLPLIFGLLSIGAMAWLSFELFQNARAALIAASLYAISPFAVMYAQEARETTLWALETLVLSALLLRGARTGEIKCWLAYALTATISLYTYPLTAVVMAAHALTVVASPALRQRSVILPYFLASAGATLPFLPWLAVLGNSTSGLKALGNLLSNKPTAVGVILTFMRDIKATMVDVGMVAPGTPARLAVTITGTAILALVLYCLARLTWVSSRATSNRFILALFAIPVIPLLLIHSGALIGQLRYQVPTYLAIQLALTSFYHSNLAGSRATRPRQLACAATYVLIVAISALSCFIYTGADTWYHKAYQRSVKVAAIINQSRQPLVVADLGAPNYRSTSPVLELAYYLDPGVAMRVNLNCEACLLPAAAPIDVFSDANQFRNVYVLGPVKRTIPEGPYTVTQVGIDIDPTGNGPLEIFAQYPR